MPFREKTLQDVCLKRLLSSLLGVRYHLRSNDLFTRSSDLF